MTLLQAGKKDRKAGTSLVQTLLLLITCLAPIQLLFAVEPALAQLDGISEIGHSYQSDARGGCETSIGDTALAHVRQPASVMLQAHGRFDSKITNVFVLNNSWTNPTHRTQSLVNQLLSYNLGVVHALGSRYALGLAWETGGWSTNFQNQAMSANFLRPVYNSVGYKRYTITANLGAKVTDKVFIGAGPHIDIMRFSTNLPVANALMKWPSTYSVGAGYQLGMLYHPTRKVSLGASFSSPSYMGNLSNKVTFDMPGEQSVSTRAELGAITLPGRVSFGAAYLPSEKLKMAVEGAYLNYGSSLLGNAKVKAPFNFTFGPGFRNLWVINTGADFDINRYLSGSVGYVFNTKPISGNNMVPFYAANAQNQLTWGLRLKKGRAWTGFAHIIGLPSLTHSTGNDHLAFGSQFANSTVRQMLQSFNCGVGFSF